MWTAAQKRHVGEVASCRAKIALCLIWHLPLSPTASMPFCRRRNARAVVIRLAVITPMRSRKAMPISINVHRVGQPYHCAREPAWRATKSLSPANGVEKPRETALIDEAVCIGCTKCILACPVDAIVGASK